MERNYNGILLTPELREVIGRIPPEPDIPYNEREEWAGSRWREPEYYAALQKVFDIGGYKALSHSEWIQLNGWWARQECQGDVELYYDICRHQDIYYWHDRAQRKKLPGRGILRPCAKAKCNVVKFVFVPKGKEK